MREQCAVINIKIYSEWHWLNQRILFTLEDDNLMFWIYMSTVQYWGLQIIVGDIWYICWLRAFK